MASVTWRFERTVEAPPDAVFDWLADLRADDHTSEAFLKGSGFTPKQAARARREILARNGDILDLEDTWARNKLRSTVTIERAERVVRIEGEGGYRGRWSAEPTEGGTRVVSQGEMVPTNRFYKLLLPLFKGKLLAQMEKDFDGHLEEIRVDLAGCPEDS